MKLPLFSTANRRRNRAAEAWWLSQCQQTRKGWQRYLSSASAYAACKNISYDALKHVEVVLFVKHVRIMLAFILRAKFSFLHCFLWSSVKCFVVRCQWAELSRKDAIWQSRKSGTQMFLSSNISVYPLAFFKLWAESRLQTIFAPVCERRAWYTSIRSLNWKIQCLVFSLFPVNINVSISYWTETGSTRLTLAAFSILLLYFSAINPWCVINTNGFVLRNVCLMQCFQPVGHSSVFEWATELSRHLIITAQERIDYIQQQDSPVICIQE